MSIHLWVSVPVELFGQWVVDRKVRGTIVDGCGHRESNGSAIRTSIRLLDSDYSRSGYCSHSGSPGETARQKANISFRGRVRNFSKTPAT